jgi:hypothetical protein
VLADSPMIVCRNCGETWPVSPRRTRRPAFPTTEHDPRPVSALIEAERRPLITFSDGAQKAWAAKIEGDVLPEMPQDSRFAATATMTAALAAILFVGALLGGREAAVAALPDLAGLYAAVGLPVNLDGLAIEDVRAERLPPDRRLTVRGLIRNVSGVDRAARPLVVNVMDAVAQGVGSRDFDPPAATIAAGEAVPFILEFQDLPEEAAEISIRFRRPFEPLHTATAEP